MNNIFGNPLAVLIGAILVLVGGLLAISHAPDMILFSGLLALFGKICVATGGFFMVVALYLLFS